MVLNTIRIFDKVQKLSCENIMLQSYHLVLQKCENLKYHLHRPTVLELLAYTPINTIFIDILIVNAVTFIIFAFLVVFSSI